MAEETSDPPATPKKKEFGSRKMGQNSAGSLNYGRSSIGLDRNGDDTRSRYSASIMIPHYLRPSTGSCHDICKYGRRRAFEEEAKIALNKKRKTTKSSLLVKPSPDAKSFLPKLRASLDPKTLSPRLNASSSRTTRLPTSPTKKEMLLLPMKVEVVPVKQGNSSDNKMSRTDKKTYGRQSVKHSSSVKSKLLEVQLPSTSANSDGVHGKKRTNNDVEEGRMMRASTTLGKARGPLSPKLSLSKTAMGKARKSARVNLLSHQKDQNWIDRVDTETTNSEVCEKTLHVIKTGMDNNNGLESVPDNHTIPAVASPSSLLHEEDDVFASDNTVSMDPLKVGMGKNASESTPDGHAIPALSSQTSPESSFYAKPPSLLSHEKDVGDIDYGGNDADEIVTDNIVSMEMDKVQPVKENYKRTRRMGIENNRFKSMPALPSTSSSKSPSLFSDKDDDDKLVFGDALSVAICEAQPLKRKHYKTLEKNRGVISGGKYCPPVKLQFRSGKVVELKQYSSFPGRIRFRRTRSVPYSKKSAEIDNVEPFEEKNKTLRKTGVVFTEKIYCAPANLFRSEKLVSLGWNTNTPWRLRFRRARILERKGGFDLKRIIKNVGDAGEFSSQKVSLKHQDVQWKKKSQCLFNNVIEETASKLAESRRSKVKALVGAFETVISLQERKPPSLRAAC